MLEPAIFIFPNIDDLQIRNIALPTIARYTYFLIHPPHTCTYTCVHLAVIAHRHEHSAEVSHEGNLVTWLLVGSVIILLWIAGMIGMAIILDAVKSRTSTAQPNQGTLRCMHVAYAVGKISIVNSSLYVCMYVNIHNFVLWYMYVELLFHYEHNFLSL